MQQRHAGRAGAASRAANRISAVKEEASRIRGAAPAVCAKREVCLRSLEIPLEIPPKATPPCGELNPALHSQAACGPLQGVLSAHSGA